MISEQAGIYGIQGNVKIFFGCGIAKRLNIIIIILIIIIIIIMIIIIHTR